MTSSTSRCLRVRHGAGAVHEVPVEALAASANRPVREILRAVARTAGDAALEAALQNPEVVVDAYVADRAGADAGAGEQEMPISPDEPFDRIAQLLERSEVELGVALRHQGGAADSTTSDELDGLRYRFGSQPVLAHEAGYKPTPDDLDAMFAGRAFFIAGTVIAAEDALVEEAPYDSEILWYYVAPEKSPIVAVDVLVPEQTASASDCLVDGQNVLRAARSAARRGLRIIGAAHSHGRAAVFTSGVDEAQMERLAAEGVGVTISRWTTHSARVTAAHAGAAHITACHVAADEGGPQIIVESANGWPIRRETHLNVRIRRSATVTCFATANGRGERLVPTIVTERCGICGCAHTRRVDAREVTVHVIGPVSLPQARRDELEDLVRQRVRSALPVPAAVYGGPDEYVIWSGGVCVGSVPVHVLKAAAESCPALADALRWRSGWHTNRGAEDFYHG